MFIEERSKDKVSEIDVFNDNGKSIKGKGELVVKTFSIDAYQVSEMMMVLNITMLTFQNLKIFGTMEILLK